jgi:DNA processing protein
VLTQQRFRPFFVLGAVRLPHEDPMDLRTAVALSTIPGVSRVRAAAVFKDLREHSRSGTVGLEDVITSCLTNCDVRTLAAQALNDATLLLAAAPPAGIDAMLWSDDRYPPLLRMIPDPPPVLWVRGCIEILARPAVAIVGSRAATPYALEVAARLGAELATRGLTVVSGLARGADGAAHKGCLSAGGSTVGVLGSGVDVIYPAEHRQLAVSICKSGCLISDLGPGAPPLPEHFPLRNRLISGISLAVVVVEASEQSGSLITARYGLEQGRDVMAVPGSVLSGRNRGSHGLLKDGAKVVETADDILEGLGWPDSGPVGTPAAPDSGKQLKTDQLLEKMVVGEPYDFDQLANVTGLAGPKLLARLTEWELQGRVVRIGGGRFRRVAQTV